MYVYIYVYIYIPSKKKKKYILGNERNIYGQHMLKPDQIIANEQSSIQSASAISSSVKLPTTSTPKEKTDQIDSAPKPNPFPSISSDDLIPVESIPSLYNDLNTDDELAEINRMEEKIFKMPSPKRSHRTRKSRRDRSGSSRRLRSRNRDNNYKFSDEESDHQQQHVSSPTEIWGVGRHGGTDRRSSDYSPIPPPPLSLSRESSGGGAFARYSRVPSYRLDLNDANVTFYLPLSNWETGDFLFLSYSFSPYLSRSTTIFA